MNYAQNSVYNPGIMCLRVNRKLVWNNVLRNTFKGIKKLSDILIDNFNHSHD